MEVNYLFKGFSSANGEISESNPRFSDPKSDARPTVPQTDRASKNVHVGHKLSSAMIG